MNNNSDQVSFVFPVYNEAGVIERTLRSFYDEFKGKIDFEMIVAEDGSTDGTKKILKGLKRELSLKLYLNEDRKGYLPAIRDALRYTSNTWIFLADSDNQFDPHDFWKLWLNRNDQDIILGIKTDRKDGALRKYLSKGYNLLLRIFFRVPYIDMDTGFRLFRKTVSDKLAPSIKVLGFFTAEFVIKAHVHGYRILEIPVKHFKQQSRPSNIFHLNKLPMIIVRELQAILHLFKEIKLQHESK